MANPVELEAVVTELVCPPQPNVMLMVASGVAGGLIGGGIGCAIVIAVARYLGVMH